MGLYPSYTSQNLALFAHGGDPGSAVEADQPHSSIPWTAPAVPSSFTSCPGTQHPAQRLPGHHTRWAPGKVWDEEALPTLCWERNPWSGKGTKGAFSLGVPLSPCQGIAPPGLQLPLCSTGSPCARQGELQVITDPGSNANHWLCE